MKEKDRVKAWLDKRAEYRWKRKLAQMAWNYGTGRGFNSRQMPAERHTPVVGEDTPRFVMRTKKVSKHG